MESYIQIVEEHLEMIPYNELIVVSDFYKKHCNEVTESALAKIFERFSKNGKLVHLTKGIYYRPKNSRFGVVPISEDEIVKFYLRNMQGIITGNRLYNNKGITTQVGKKIEILTNNINEDQKNIGNISIKKIDMELNEETIPAIETLELLQNYYKIEDVNNRAFADSIKIYAEKYSDSTMDYVLSRKKYKKSTIAFLAAFLDEFNVKNSLNKYLSPMSKYKIPDMEEFYEFA